jgi:hypothetical protein
MEGKYEKPIGHHCKTTLTFICTFIYKIRYKINVFEDAKDGRRLSRFIIKDEDYVLRRTKCFLNFDCLTEDNSITDYRRVL